MAAITEIKSNYCSACFKISQISKSVSYWPNSSAHNYELVLLVEVSSQRSREPLLIVESNKVTLITHKTISIPSPFDSVHTHRDTHGKEALLSVQLTQAASQVECKPCCNRTQFQHEKHLSLELNKWFCVSRRPTPAPMPQLTQQGSTFPAEVKI